MAEGDRAILQRLEQHEAASREAYQDRFNDLDSSHANLRAYVEQLKLVMRRDSTQLASEVHLVKDRLDEHTTLLAVQTTRISEIADGVRWLRNHWWDSRIRKDSSIEPLSHEDEHG